MISKDNSHNEYRKMKIAKYFKLQYKTIQIFLSQYSRT